MDIALLSKSERIAALAQWRRDGIGQSNATILAGCGSSTDLACEHKCEREKVICSRCGGVFKKRYFYRHSKNHCPASAVTRPDPVAVPNVQDAEAAHDPLWAKVLSEMDRDAIFEIVKADPTILRLGKNTYDERKPNKEKAARNKARSAMRRMARLLQLTKGVETLAALLDVSNFYLLQEAIVEMCVEGGKSNPGLKVALGSLKDLSPTCMSQNDRSRLHRWKYSSRFSTPIISRCFLRPNTN